MKKMSKVLSLLLVVAMLLAMAACGDNPGTTGASNATNPSTGSKEPGAQTTYSVSVKTIGGMPMSELDVYIYEDNEQGDLKKAGKTDANGQVNFDLKQQDNYVAVLNGVPEGYAVEAYYAFSGNNCQITLVSSLIKDKDVSGVQFEVGDVMYDFQFTTPEGETIKLSDVLAEKKMVMLNFWYSTCSWCVTEFPVVEEAYQEYKDQLEIFALDPYPTDTDGDVIAMRESMGLTFPMGRCDMGFSPSNFGSQGYPTSVFIDRYGVVCLIEEGAVTSTHAMTSAYKHFTAENYEQKLCPNGLADLVTQLKPEEVLDPEDYLTSDQMDEIMTNGDFNVTYRYDENEYSWPFIRAEYEGDVILKTSNAQVDSSYAILYMDVELKAGEAIGFDYIVSTEQASDVVVIIVNDKDVYQISGNSKEDGWKGCYPWVATEDGTYEVAVCYIKDGSTNSGDDTFYIKNLRVVNEADIDVDSYIPREAAVELEDGSYQYVDIIMNEEDGYYHIGTVDGPLLLANMMGYSQFSQENSVWMMFYNGEIVLDGVNYAELGEKYAGLANNSNLTGYCPVNQELADLLKIVAQVKGFDGTEQEWLKICEYYNSYGPDGTQLEDPIKGLSPQSAYKAEVGKGWYNVETGEYSETNCFYFNGTPIMPRGKFAEFIPEKSGAYMITSYDSSAAGIVDGWIFSEDTSVPMYQSNRDYRDYQNGLGAIMIYYMEAGTPYYINMAFYDLYEVGYIAYEIKYLGATFDLFRLASPATFTYDSDATGDQIYELVHGGIDVVLGDDGYYYHDLGNGKAGSAVYATFTDITGVISAPIASLDANGNVVKDGNSDKITVKGLIDRGAFDFSKTERDQQIVAYIQQHDGDIEATDAYLRQEWGETYEENASLYLLEEVYAAYRGERDYHGAGKDYTEQMRSYLDKLIKNGKEDGCVKVDVELAEMLQAIMDKYTFDGVEFSWLKLCYYYQYLGYEG